MGRRKFNIRTAQFTLFFLVHFFALFRKRIVLLRLVNLKTHWCNAYLKVFEYPGITNRCSGERKRKPSELRGILRPMICGLLNYFMLDYGDALNYYLLLTPSLQNKGQHLWKIQILKVIAILYCKERIWKKNMIFYKSLHPFTMNLKLYQPLIVVNVNHTFWWHNVVRKQMSKNYK